MQVKTTPVIPYQPNSEELDNCAKEEIHNIQYVQPHGFLIACDVQSGLISFVSRNLHEFLPTSPVDVLGTSLIDLIDAPADTVMKWLRAARLGSPMSIDCRFDLRPHASRHFEVLTHRVDETVIFEAVPVSSRDSVSLQDQSTIEEMVKGVGSLNQKKSLDEFLHACVDEIRHLSGYQRVFIYRFLPDWSGDVIAESVDEGCVVRFLGLRFPASDIPPQARALYKVNLLRVIGDVDGDPVEVLPHTPRGLLDQSNSNLRSPSPMHLRYLQNMGVKATMTISLLKDGELWGLASCHHDCPRVPPSAVRQLTKLLCALLAEVAVTRIDAMLHREALNKKLRFREILQNLTNKVAAGTSVRLDIGSALRDFADAINVQQVGLMIAGEWICTPSVDPALLQFLQMRAQRLEPETVFSSSQLAHDADMDVDSCRPLAGAMALKIPATNNSCLLLLREEVIQQVNWGGAPGNEKYMLANGLQVLGPRASFASWVQLMYGQSEAWNRDEKNLAIEVARVIGNARVMDRERVMQAQLSLLGSCMEHLNDMVIVTDTISIDEPGPTIIYVNQAFETTTGYTREEVIGRTPRLLQGLATERAQLNVLRAAILSWQSVTVELINYKKDGSPFWVEISLAPIADSTGCYTHWVAIERTIDDRKKAEDAMRQLVNYDPLTKLPNRRVLMDRLPMALSASRRHCTSGALLFIDLDHFKNLNDTEGHQVGDDLLQQVASRLTSLMRLEDTVARLGGDEFVVMLESLSEDEAEATAATQKIAENIVALLAQPFNLSGRQYSTSASLGIAFFHHSDCERTVDELLKEADFAMYESKLAGRNTWRFFDPRSQAAFIEKNILEGELRKALTDQQLQLYYQPIVDREAVITGFEALMRWHHPTRGWVPPSEFIAVAEYSGLIVPIGQWAIAQACAMLNSWATSETRGIWTLAVNVSAQQIRQSNFVDNVKLHIAQSGCDPRLLILELTESLLQHDFDATIAKMEELRAVGVTFSIDDFGTGYSSLAYLQRLPISVLKIDQSFVRDIGSDSDDMAICMMILALGETLKLSIVAEGVETTAQYEYLKSHGCDKFQGFLFSPAVHAGKLMDGRLALIAYVNN